jgi:hypothetical protein
MICAVIHILTRSLPQPRPPADSSSPRKGDRSALAAAVCDRSSRDRKCDDGFGSAYAGAKRCYKGNDFAYSQIGVFMSAKLHGHT